MPTKSKFAKQVRDADDIVHIFTGKRIKDHVKRVVELVSEDIEQKVAGAVMGEGTPIPENGPYAVLHCRPDSSDEVIKFRFRSLVRDLHPDSGRFPDAKEFQKVAEAYKTICEERKNKK